MDDQAFRERQERIDAAARAALNGMLASVGGSTGSPHAIAGFAYDYAEALEAERARRIK